MTCEHDKIVEVVLRGQQGAKGDTFFPEVDEDGIFRLTNDGGRPNPDPVDLAGAIVRRTAENVQKAAEEVAKAEQEAAKAKGFADASEAAQTAAEAAKIAAEAARSKAEKSVVDAGLLAGDADGFAQGAHNSAVSAETAKSAAIDAANAAARSEDAAKLAETGAKAAKSQAETSATNAGRSATAASASATAASASASAASGSATSASTSASAAATSATQAQASATAAAGSATACVAIVDGATEAITEGVLNSDQLAAEAKKVKTLQRQVANLRAAAAGQLYTDESDSDAAYAKAVPSGAMPYAALESIGGKSIVMNQFVPPEVATFTANGVTVSSGGDGSIYVSGTAENNEATLLTPSDTGTPVIKLSPGHKIFVRGLPTGMRAFLQLRRTIETGETRFVENLQLAVPPLVATLPSSVFDHAIVLFRPNEAGDTFSETIQPQIIDLTLAGLASATAAEIDAMFPDYVPYTEPQISSASVTQVSVQGRNIVDPSTRGQSESTTVANFGSSPLRAGTAYTMSLTPTVTNTGLVFYFHDAAGAYKSQQFTFAKANVLAGQRISSTVVPNTDIAEIRAYAGQGLNECKDIQIEEASTATSYAPYTKSEVAIPAAVRDLPGYGWSAGSVCNEVDFERKVYVQRVGRVDLGSISFTRYASSSTPFWYAPNSAIADMAFCDSTGNTLTNCPGATGVTKVQAANIRIYTESESAPSGYLYYELSTPIETDISDLLPEDLEILQVEPGGSVTFVQSDSTKRLPVPSTIDYEIKTSEA